MAPKSKSVIGSTREDRSSKLNNFEKVNFEVAEPQSAILLLHSNEQPVVYKALSALDKFAVKSQDNLSQLYGLTLVQYLLPLIIHDDNCLRRYSIKLLAELCALPEVRAELIQDENIIPHFVEVLSKEQDDIIQEFASLLLAEFTTERYACIKVMENPIIGVLLERMASRDPDIQKNSLQILYNILEDPIFVEEISQSETLELKNIVAHMLSKYPVIQTLAIGVLKNFLLMQDEELHKKFHREGGIDAAMNILEDIDCKDIHKKVLSLLEVVSTTEVSAKHIAEVNGPQRLKEYMHTIKDTELVEAALAIIIELATFKSGRQILHELNMVKDLSSLLKSGKSSIMGKACRGLALMSQYYESLQTIIAENPIKEIVNTIISDQYPMSTRLAAAQALSELLNADKRICLLLLEGNRQESLEYLLSLPSESIPVELAICLVVCLKQMVYYEDIREKVLETGFIKSLICCFQDKNRDHLSLRVEACYALADSLTDAVAREQFLNLNGVEHIMECLKHRNLMLNQAAATVLVAISCDSKLSAAFLRAGALDWMLQDKEKRTRYECPVWETAIEALLRSHLPIKFAYMSRLDIQDVTEDGFYVTRHVERPFQLLEELLEMEVCPIRPIYVANFNARTEKMTSKPSSMVEILNSPPKSPRSSRISVGKQRSYSSVKKRKSSSKLVVKESMVLDEKPMVKDQHLPVLLEDLQAKLAHISSQSGVDESDATQMEKIVRAVAEVVCNHMGGFEVNSTDRCDHHRQELHLFELKRELGTNVIPLGHIRVGRFLERAMLFKVLADRIGLPCSLVRGEYQRAWVEIAIPESAYEEKLAFPSTIPRKSSSLLTTDSGRILHHIATQWLPQPEPEPEPEEVVTCNKQFVPGYMVKPNRVVDLMWEIGSLYPLKTYKAVQYCNIPEVDRPSVTSTQMFNIT